MRRRNCRGSGLIALHDAAYCASISRPGEQVSTIDYHRRARGILIDRKTEDSLRVVFGLS